MRKGEPPMRIRIWLTLFLVCATSDGAALAQSPAGDVTRQTIKDAEGNMFMEETTAPTPRRKKPNVQIDLSNVGVQTDPNGKIIPLLAPGAPPVKPFTNSTQAYTEYFVPTPYGSVPIIGPGFPYAPPFAPGLYPGFGLPFGAPYGAPYGAPFGGYPGGVNLGLGIGGRRFGLGVGLNAGYPGYGYPGFGGGYSPFSVPSSVAPFGFPNPGAYGYYPVIYGNGTLAIDADIQTSTGLGIGPNLGSARSQFHSYSTPNSLNASKYVSTPWLNSSAGFGSNTSLLSPLLSGRQF